MFEGDSFFKGRRAVLLTRHRKEQVIKTVLEEALDCDIIVEAGFDTDSFGTFTRQIDRPGSQIDTARLKAIKGMELTGIDIGLASEGSFAPHPLIPFLPWNLEIVLLLDKRENLEIFGEYAGSETNYSHMLIAGFPEAEDFALKAGFPEHWLVLRPDNDRHQSVIKAINTWEHLKDAVKWGLGKSTTGKVFLETDMRAHANPTRMINIGKAAENLARKIKQKCPRCGTPGFSVVERKSGLPCEWCERPTEGIKALVFACRRCGFSKEETTPRNVKAPAGRCQYCNP
jgi:hypothetical protein